MNKQELIKYWKMEEKRSFSGWDFRSINEKTDEEETDWSYDKIIKEHLNDDSRLLDMGTGGGEFLLSLNHPYQLTSVTEGYPPNYKLCLDFLQPKGITVKYVGEDGKLAFEDEEFDLVINRHESFDLNEVKRILKADGLFITQQVGNEDVVDLSRMVLDNEEYVNEGVKSLEDYLGEAENLDFELIYENECFPLIKFRDVGTLVYFARIIEWQFPGFSVENNLKSLEKIHQIIEDDGFIGAKQHRLIMVLKKRS